MDWQKIIFSILKMGAGILVFLYILYLYKNYRVEKETDDTLNNIQILASNLESEQGPHVDEITVETFAK